MLDRILKNFQKYAANHAFCISDEKFTYSNLCDATAYIQDLIEKAGGSQTRRIGIVMHDNFETYASVFACWFSGYAYVPLNPRNPAERNTTIVHESLIDLILNCQNDSFGLDTTLTVVPTILQSSVINKKGIIRVAQRADDDLMYILFTSGSTGVPKGVPITYRNLNTFINSYFDLKFECDENDRFLQMFDLSFDVSIASFLIPVLLGACVYTVPSTGIKYLNVVKIIQRHKISFATVTPSVINYLKPYFDEIHLPSLRYCILTAEASDANNVLLFSKCTPYASIYNLYGPTEGTIWCTGYQFNSTHPKSYHNMLCIGKPFTNVDVFIQNESGKEATVNEKGELCIAGDQLTLGYINSTNKNKQSFFIHDNRRFYRTGDMCFIDEDGDIIYCSRYDFQVKIQGFRVELAEIEVTAHQLLNINVAAIALNNKSAVSVLILFTEKCNQTESNIKKELAKKLPYYMIPSRIIDIDLIPYNSSGKIDRVQLRNMAEVMSV